LINIFILTLNYLSFGMCQDIPQLKEQEKTPPPMSARGAGKDRAGMPGEMAESSAAEFHEEKTIN